MHLYDQDGTELNAVDLLETIVFWQYPILGSKPLAMPNLPEVEIPTEMGPMMVPGWMAYDPMHN